jgi:4a-hydroxytetrahydrobiopterin dehydratase
MGVQKLDEVSRNDALTALPLWQYDGGVGGIRRSFKFSDFAAAFAFMSRDYGRKSRSSPRMV